MAKAWGSALKGMAIAALLGMTAAGWAQEAGTGSASPPAAAEPAAAEPAAAERAALDPASPEAAARAIGTAAAALVAGAEAHQAAQLAAADAAAGDYVRTAPTPGIGQPRPRGIALQQPMTPIAERAHRMMNWFLNPVIFAISIFVLALMGWIIVRYRAAANPEAATFTHNSRLEVIWTAVPALILLVIAVPSFALLAAQYDPPRADITIKVTGYQWYWGYEYPDYGDIGFDSLPLDKAAADAEGVPYLLDVDNRLVVPAGKTVKLLITAADVLHSFAVPSFWVKMDAVPGRINETWFKVDRPGVYYGQCSELCGTKHGFMPIAVEVLPEEQFRAWVRQRQRADGIEPTGPGIADDRSAAALPVAATTRDTPAPVAPPAA